MKSLKEIAVSKGLDVALSYLTRMKKSAKTDRMGRKSIPGQCEGTADVIKRMRRTRQQLV